MALAYFLTTHQSHLSVANTKNFAGGTRITFTQSDTVTWQISEKAQHNPQKTTYEYGSTFHLCKKFRQQWEQNKGSMQSTPHPNPHLIHCTQPVLPVLCCRLQYQKHSLKHKQLPSTNVSTCYTCTHFNYIQKYTWNMHYNPDPKWHVGTSYLRSTTLTDLRRRPISTTYWLLSHIKHYYLRSDRDQGNSEFQWG
jgi:hypothetical protein